MSGHESLFLICWQGRIDLVLMVIDATEGSCPRPGAPGYSGTSQVKGIIVIAKDLVDAEWLEMVVKKLSMFAGSFLARAPLHVVSSFTGEGIQELKTAIEQMLDTVTRDKDAPCAFLLIGPLRFRFGTVVAGTLLSGTISTGKLSKYYRKKRVSGKNRGLWGKGRRSFNRAEGCYKSGRAGKRVQGVLLPLRIFHLTRFLDARLNF